MEYKCFCLLQPPFTPPQCKQGILKDIRAFYGKTKKKKVGGSYCLLYGWRFAIGAIGDNERASEWHYAN